MKTYQFKVPDDWDIEDCCFTAFNDGKIKLTRDHYNGIYEMLTIDVELCEESNTIEIGDEVSYQLGEFTGIVAMKKDKADGKYVGLLWKHSTGGFAFDLVRSDNCTKTGRHFDQIDALIDFFKKED